jgi:predicted DNA-binding protein with PD1-like motif
MRYVEAKQGRVFVISLEHGERLPETLEEFARRQNVRNAFCLLVGGVDDGSRIVVGPRSNSGRGPVPMEYELRGVHEVLGTGTLFPDEEGNPVLHLHVSAGRKGRASTGCSLAGIDVWKIGEVVLVELLADGCTRVLDPDTGFKTLVPGPGEE